MSSPASSPGEALAEGSRDAGRDRARRQLALTTGGRLKQMNQHHPYRIELLDLTPVSVSLLWSTRPPPLSAIPQSIVTTPLRQRFQTRTLPNGTASPPAASAAASAVSTLPNPVTTAGSSHKTTGKASHGRQHTQTSEASSNAGSARASPTPGASQDAPIHRLAEGLIATRSLNRKVTKIRLRGPSSVSAAGRRASNGMAVPDARARPHDDDAAASDDGGTIGVDDDAMSGSEGSDSGFEGDHKGSNMVQVFEKRVSVTVNGHDWPHVLMGDRGSHEAIVVIFGLQPESDYDIHFEVKVGLDGTPETARVPTVARIDRGADRGVAEHSGSGAGGARGVVSAVMGTTSAIVRPSSPSPLGKMTLSADTDSEVVKVQKKALLQAELEASEGMKADVLAELRKARKETSKAESNLRHEIESIKRHADRMSSTDHRSKQKVLALQEAIKQTTAHVKEIHDEAEDIEGEQASWDQQEAEVAKELEHLRREVDAEDAEVEAQLQSDEAEIAAVEKELKAAEAALRSKEADRDGLQDERLPALEAEIAKLQAQIKDVLSKPLHARRGGHVAGRGGRGGGSGPNHMVPSQALPRSGKNGPGLGHPSGPGGRGGKGLHGHNPRAASGPAAQGSHANQQSGFKTFFPGGSQGNAARSYRSTNNLRPDGGAGSISIHAPFDPTTHELPYTGGFSSLHAQDAMYGGGAHPAGFGAMGGGPYGGHYGQEGMPPGSHDYNGGEISPTGSDRRSSLPLPQLFGKTHSSMLNPNNPEFVPSASSANASPVMLKETLGGRLSGGKQTLNSTPPGGASIEHSPTSSSRFAFPLARHGASGAGAFGKPTGSANAAPSPIGSDRTPAQVGEASTTNPLLPNSQLFPPPSGAGGGAFSRPSPLLPGAVAQAASGSSPLLYGSNSPRFAAASFNTGPDDASTSGQQDAGFATSKFGPLDYDPGLENFGPGLGSGVFGASSGIGAASSSPFGSSSNGYPSLFGSNSAWTPSGQRATTSVGSGGSAVGSAVGPSIVNASAASNTSLWAAPSPQLGGGLAMPGTSGDIWSPPTISNATAPASSLRTKLSLGDFGHRSAGLGAIGTSHDIAPNFGPGGGASGFLSGAAGFRSGVGGGAGSRLVNMSAPVSPTSPHHPELPATSAGGGSGGTLPPFTQGQDGSSVGESSDVEILAEIAEAVSAEQQRQDAANSGAATDEARDVDADADADGPGSAPSTPSFAAVAAAAKAAAPSSD